MVSLPAAGLLARLPGEISREGGSAEERHVEIPCRDLLTGNTPGISLGRLRELLPDLVELPPGRDAAERITLPPGWIALHFQMVTRCEELPPEANPTLSGEERPKEVIDLEVVETTGPDGAVAEAVLIETGKLADSSTGPGDHTKATKEPEAADQQHRKSLFEALPIFRRRHPAESAVEELPVARSEEKKAPPPVASPVLEESKELTVERLWKLDPQDALADPSSLQSLFMTEEKLTLERVVSKAGELPGLRACVLAHGDQVLCASNPSTGVDLRTLSGRAMTMLAQIREASAGMGLGAVPAVTLHAEQGALSFLHNGELCLLVLHADRGFVPGVRERLQEMLGHLVDARPALREGSPVAEARESKDESL